MSKIIDNSTVKLAERLKETLPHSKHLDACVGYFNLRGWQQIREESLALVPRGSEPPVRMLIGMALSEDQELRRELMANSGLGGFRIDLGRAMQLAQSAVEGFVKQLSWGLPSAQDLKALRELRSDLSDGRMTVKFSARHPLHAKLYICHLDGGLGGFRATVGSSNLTRAGLGGQGELNLEETDQETAKELSRWFDEKWEDPFAIDVTQELIQVIDDSWAQVPQPQPYLVHLRLAYELSRDARNGLLLDIPEHVRKDLLPHQESAVRVATQMLERKGLAVIGDVVGLGKTLSGTAIAASIGETVLVICPKNLVSMWKSVLDHYAVPSNVISLSMVDKHLPALRRYKLVLVDESHNLRHKTRIDWRAIRNYIELNDPMLVLMTATMFNADHLDISGQLALKFDLDQDLGMRPERLIEEIGEIELAQKTGGKLTTLEAFNRSHYVEDWQRLLSQFLVRRTRRFLETNYGEVDQVTGRVSFKFPNGNTFTFPTRKAEPLAYVGGENDPGERLASEENFKAISKLTFARYQLGDYLREEVVGVGIEEQQYVDDLIKSKTTAAGFIRTTAYKRLASSPHAFLTTIDRMLMRNRMLEFAIESRQLLPVGTYSESGIVLIGAEDEDIEENEIDDFHNHSEIFKYGAISTEEAARYSYSQLLARSPKGLKWMRPELFKSQELLKDLREDSAFLQSLINEYGNWNPEADTKLDALEDLITSLGENPKVLVFSEYADTVEYLYATISKRLPTVRVEKATSKSEDPTSLARRFSPISNHELGGLPEGDSEIDVLITTDVLSEGQNLQDCAVVVNWDMPWTIIKIIQRAGRVDRIGQNAETIRVLTFLAQDSVESKIRNMERLKNRLKIARDILGHDEDFFNDIPKDLDYVDGLFDGSADLIGDEGDVDYSSYALGIWNAASDEFQKAARKLGLGSKSTLAGSALDQVLIYCQTQNGYDILNTIVAGNENEVLPVTVAPIEALKLSECTPDTTIANEFQNHYELVARAFSEGVVKTLDQAMVITHSGLRKRLYNFLTEFRDRYKGTLFDLTEAEELMNQLVRAPIKKSNEKTIVDLLRHANRSNDSLHVVGRLVEMYQAGELLDQVSIEDLTPELVLSLGMRTR